MIVESSRSAVMDFFADRLGIYRSEDFRGILWVPEKYTLQIRSMDHVAVGAGFNAFIGKTCCMHVVIQAPELLNRHMIREAFDYAFNTCGVEYIFGLVDSANKAAIEFDTRLGFKEVNRIPDAGIDGDLIIFGMPKAGCRWLKENRHGQKESAASP